MNREKKMSASDAIRVLRTTTPVALSSSRRLWPLWHDGFSSASTGRDVRISASAKTTRLILEVLQRVTRTGAPGAFIAGTRGQGGGIPGVPNRYWPRSCLRRLVATWMLAEATNMSQGRYRSLDDPETLRQFIANLREGIYITTQQGEILDANPACVEIFGASSLKELKSFRVQDLYADPERRDEETDRLARDGMVREYELVLRRPDGLERTVLDTCSSIEDPETGEILYHGILVDITHRKLLETRFQEQSLRDPLTGCFNRRFLKEVEKKLGALDTWGAIVVDVDNFKELNDSYGHQKGDEVLVRISRFLLQNARAEDAVVRMGGDEFLLLLLGASARFVAEVGQRLRDTAGELGISPFSLGWANRRGTESLERTIDHADRELLQIRLFERRTREKRARGLRRRLEEDLLDN